MPKAFFYLLQFSDDFGSISVIGGQSVRPIAHQQQGATQKNKPAKNGHMGRIDFKIDSHCMPDEGANHKRYYWKDVKQEGGLQQRSRRNTEHYSIAHDGADIVEGINLHISTARLCVA